MKFLNPMTFQVFHEPVRAMAFFFASLGVDPAQNLAKHKRLLYVLIQLTNRSIVIM